MLQEYLLYLNRFKLRFPFSIIYKIKLYFLFNLYIIMAYTTIVVSSTIVVSYKIIKPENTKYDPYSYDLHMITEFIIYYLYRYII